MNAKFRLGRLLGWLTLTHLVAALIAVLVFHLATRQGLPSLVSAAAGVALALLAALLLTEPLRHGIEVATLAMARLLDGLPTAPLPTPSRSPVAALLFAVNALVRHYGEVNAAREGALRQAQEAAIREERNRLARDLHDSIKQQLFSLSASIAAAQVRWERDPPGARLALDDARRSAQEASAEMRALLQQLRPAALAGAGLPQALAEQCEALRYRTGADVRCEFSEMPAPERMPAGAGEGLFRIAQEALNNIARHAGAKTVLVRLRTNADPAEWLELEITDDGRGFEPALASGMGLANMRERGRELGARLDVIAASGAGVRIRVRVALTEVDSDREDRVNESLQAFVKQGRSGLFWAVAGVGVALLALLPVIPYAARLLPLGGFSGLNLIFGLGLPLIVALVALAAAARGRGRSRKAVAALALAGEQGKSAIAQLARDRAGTLMWSCLIAAIILPGVLLRPDEPQFPVAALVLGAGLVALAIYQIVKQVRATEEYWASLPKAAMRREVDSAWQQRYVPLLVLAVTVPGYVLLRFGGDPMGAWFAFPPAREDVFNMIAALYLVALVIWFALQWRQVRRWRDQAALST
jgi:signal transduction histidine kinase